MWRQGQMDNAAAFWDVVVVSWKGALEEVVHQLPSSPPQTPWGKECFAGTSEHLEAKDAVPKLVITEVCEMLQVGTSPSLFFLFGNDSIMCSIPSFKLNVMNIPQSTCRSHRTLLWI